MGLGRITSNIASVLALLTTSAVASAEVHEPSVELRRWDVDPAQGMTTLAMIYAPDVKVGTAVIVVNANTWQANWEYFGFRGERPMVDFKRRRVIIFVEESICSGDGRGTIPVIALHLFSDGALVPEFFPLWGINCLTQMSETIRGYAYAVSIPRSGTPDRFTVMLDRSRHIQTPTPNSADFCAECTAKHSNSAGAEEAPVRRIASDRSAPLPALGQGLLYVLPDNTPIWLVRHWDGSVSTFDARVESRGELPAECVPGLGQVVIWQPHYRWFSESGHQRFDEWGVDVTGTLSGLLKYSTQVVDNHVVIGTVSSSTPPGKVARPRMHRMGDQEVWPMHRPFEEAPKVPVSDVLSAELDSWVVVRGVLILQSEQLAVICPEDIKVTMSHGLLRPAAESNMSAVCRPIFDLRTPNQCNGMLQGTFALRRLSPGLGSAVLTNLDGEYYRCSTPPKGFRGQWHPDGGWDWPKLGFAVSAAAQGGFVGSQFSVGALLEGSLRYHWRSTAERFWSRQLGESLELSLRARRLYAPSASAQEPAVWMLGLAPGIFDRPVHKNLTSITLLGPLIPEVGVILDANRTRAYIGWSAPYEYRLAAEAERQRPYNWADRVAIQFMPFVQRVFGPFPIHWIEGFSVGITGW